jgi:hypothetical protein
MMTGPDEYNQANDRRGSPMEPKFALEYELTSEMATEIQRTLMRAALQQGWRRDLPLILGWLAFALVLAYPVFIGWLTPGIGGGLLFFATLLALCTMYARRWRAYSIASSAVVALHTSDRRVRLEFHEQRVSLQAEYFRGEGAWSELEELMVFPAFWALRFSNSGVVVIPAEHVTPELGEFLHAKAEQVAGQ